MIVLLRLPWLMLPQGVHFQPRYEGMEGVGAEEHLRFGPLRLYLVLGLRVKIFTDVSLT